MLTGIEKQLHEAALLGKFETFALLLATIKRMNGGTFTFEKAYSLLDDYRGSLINTLINTTGPTDNLQGSDSPKAKILLAALNELAAHEYWPLCSHANVIENLPNLVTNRASKLTLAEWGVENDATSVLNHPYAQAEFYERQIKELFLAGKMNKARKLLPDAKKHGKLETFMIFNDAFANEFCSHDSYMMPKHLKPSTPFTHTQKDAFMADMLENREIWLNPLAGAHHTQLADFVTANHYVKTMATEAYQIYDAMLNLTKEKSTTGESQLKALRLLDSYFDTIADQEMKNQLATSMIYFMFDDWTLPPNPAPVTNEGKKDRLAIIKKLMTKGGQVTDLDKLASLAGTDNMVYSMPQLFADSRFFPQGISNEYLRSAMYWHPPVNGANMPNVGLFKKLCKIAKPECVIAPYNNCFAITDLIQMISDATFYNPNLPQDEHQKAVAKAHAKCLRHLMQAGLLLNIDEIRPNSHFLGFNDPATGLPYDLYQFIMNNDELRAGFMVHIRYKQLNDQYRLVKGFSSLFGELDEQTKKEMTIYDKQIAPICHSVRVKPITKDEVGGEKVATQPCEYRLNEIRERMKKPREVGLLILSHMDPLPMAIDRREKTVINLNALAEKVAKGEFPPKP